MHTRWAEKLGFHVGEVGYGMWGMGDWASSDDEQSMASLRRAVELGVNFFDTAASYGGGRSERLLGKLVAENPRDRIIVATKVPPLNMRWPATSDFSVADTFPRDHVQRVVEESIRNIGVDAIDLMQFHVWDDSWAHDTDLIETMSSISASGLVKHWGISLNRWEPANGLEAVKTGRFAAVQVVYNVLDQSPEDELLPLCASEGVAVIARVPFDEGSLTGALSEESSFPEGDPRRRYFAGTNLSETLARVRRLAEDCPPGMPLAEVALRYILSSRHVTTVIPGMRRLGHVESNTAVGDGRGLDPRVVSKLRSHRWNR